MLTKEHIKHIQFVSKRDPRYMPLTWLPAMNGFPERVQGKVKPRRTIVFNAENLVPDVPGMRFNPSIIASGDGYLYAFRNNRDDARIFCVRLDREFKPCSEGHELKLRKEGFSQWACEDPRLFRLGGELHVAYCGVMIEPLTANVCYAKINEETFEVEENWHPKVPGRQEWEKNHAYFDYEGIAQAVYMISPHQVIGVIDDVALFVKDTPGDFPWSGGRRCGGASPVLHNGEYYHFFHGSTDWNGRRQYNMGLYTFDAKPPFRIKRYSPHPIDVADPTIRHDQHCDVLFPGGVMLVDGQWVIAQGIHDKWGELRFYDFDEVEAQLEEMK